MLSDLSTTPFSEILRKLSAARHNGDLEVRLGRMIKIVFYDHGRIVFAASNVKKDRLGEALVALGRITSEEFRQASALMKGMRKRRFGEALIQSGVMDKDELGHSVARQVKRIILSLFNLNEGVASFEERECTIPLEYMVSISPHRLLFAGIKTMSVEALVLGGLGSLDRKVKLTNVPPFKFGIKRCTAEEKEILQMARKAVTLRRLAWTSGGLALSRLRSVYSFSASGILVDANRSPEVPPGPEPVVQTEADTFLLSVLRRSPDLTGREAVRKEVQNELKRSERLDRERWLRVSRRAPLQELVKALEEKMERYHALLEAVGDDEGLKNDIELILGRASSMLRTARQSEGPRTAKDLPPPSAGVPMAGTPEAPTSPTEPVTPPPPGQRPVNSSDGTEESKPAAGTAGFTANARVEHLLIQAQMSMTVGDYAAAVRSYGELVDLVPDEPGPRARLALAMACYPPTTKQAERAFLDALSLDPDSADIHYHFGLYYKSMKVRSRAIAEMRTVMQLNPTHKLARQELEAMSPRDSALKSLKKLFR